MRQIETLAIGERVGAMKGMGVNDKTILDQISALVDEEHELLRLTERLGDI